MVKQTQKNILKRIILLLFFFFTISGYIFSQNVTTIKGIVKDSLTKEPLPFVTIQFDKTTNGIFTDNDGEFKLSNRGAQTQVSVSFIGYKTKTFTVPLGKITTKEILLVSEDLTLKEVIIRPKKEKYSKKNNPAVELIEKVIANKDKNNVLKQNYQYEEYERIILSLNEFNPELRQFRNHKFIPNYIDTSIIGGKPILPISVREKISNIYHQADPQKSKKIIKAYHIEGLDQAIDTEGIDATIAETFKDIDIYDNSITLLLQSFVSPLSESRAVSFYKWYINDTVMIDNQKYINLSFTPFNSRDIGFTGDLYITTDSTYAVKRAILKTPKKMNINFIDELIIKHDYKQNAMGGWIPDEKRMAVDMSFLDAVKFYVDKTQTYLNVEIGSVNDSILENGSPIIFEKGYLKQPKTFWVENRPANHQKDYKMDKMVEDMNKVFLFKAIMNLGNLVSSGYVPLQKDPEINKFELGTIRTLYSHNSVEGNRFRLTGTTTPVFHKNLFLYGYGAYGTRDNKFKYVGEATWAFNEIKKHKDEYPKNNLTIGYKNDLNNLGQRFTQAERDNILLSLKTSKNEKMVYTKQAYLSYEKEYYGGFSFKLSAETFNESPAGSLAFEKLDSDGNKYNIKNIKTTEASIKLRYAHNEKFYQQRRQRFIIPTQKFIVDLTHTMALKDVLGGQYNYNKTSLSLFKSIWVSGYGKMNLTLDGEKIWGEAPFPLLLTPSANSSFTVQKGNFYLIEPLEFVHDSQVTWEIDYHLGGLILNRIPFIKVLKWREVAGFRGFYGSLSDRNNPVKNQDVLQFPNQTYTTGNEPYMEYSIGLENIFKFFRIDYVHRINYLDHPDINKDGFRISFDMTF